jgi:lactoylglutathione lyase
VSEAHSHTRRIPTLLAVGRSAAQVHIPPLNHIGLWVDNLAAAVSWMTKRGVRFTPGGIREGAAGHDVAFIHPKSDEACPISGNGVLIELVQAPPPVIAALTTTMLPRGAA